MFDCTPSIAMQEIAHLPHGLLEAIAMYRGYRDLFAELKAAEARNDTKTTDQPRFSLIYDIKFQLHEERKRARKQKQQA